MTQCCMGQDSPSVLLYMMHSNNNNNIRAEAARLRRASTAMAPRKKRNTHDGIPMMVYDGRFIG